MKIIEDSYRDTARGLKSASFFFYHAPYPIMPNTRLHPSLCYYGQKKKKEKKKKRRLFRIGKKKGTIEAGYGS